MTTNASIAAVETTDSAAITSLTAQYGPTRITTFPVFTGNFTAAFHHSGTYFVDCVNAGVHTTYWTTNFVTWTAINDSAASTVTTGMGSLYPTKTNGRWFFRRVGGGTVPVVTSTDLVTWTAITGLPAGWSNAVTAIASDGTDGGGTTTYVAVAGTVEGVNGRFEYATSTNLTTWTLRSMPVTVGSEGQGGASTVNYSGLHFFFASGIASPTVTSWIIGVGGSAVTSRNPAIWEAAYVTAAGTNELTLTNDATALYAYRYTTGVTPQAWRYSGTYLNTMVAIDPPPYDYLSYMAAAEHGQLIAFEDDGSGWSFDKIQRTNGGVGWAVGLVGAPAAPIVFVSDLYDWAFGDLGTMFISVNGGVSYLDLLLPSNVAVIAATETKDSGAITTSVTIGASVAGVETTDYSASGVSQYITGNCVLLALTAQPHIKEGAAIHAALRLPRLTAAVRFGIQGAGTLRALTGLSVITSQHNIIGAAVLPALVSNLSNTTSVLSEGQRIHGHPKLKRLTSSARFAFRAASTLQSLTGTGVLRARETIGGSPNLSRLRSSAALSLYGYPITGNLILPALIAGNHLIAVATLSGLTARGVLADTGGVFEGWAYNVRTGATTRLTNMPFVQVLQVPGGSLLGIGYDGNVYEIGGDTDAGAVIPWQVETGLADFGQSGMKRIPQVYLDGMVTGTIQVTVLTDDPAAEYTYDYTAAPEAMHKPHKRKLGNRIRTRNVAFRIASTTGVYVELDGIEPEIDQTQRSV